MDRAEKAEIRSTLRIAVTQSSLRSVARQVDMSPSGLGRLLDGNRPHPSTWERLRAWYVEAAPMLKRAEAETGHAALALLVQGLDPEVRSTFRKEFTALVGRLFGQAGLPAPAWLENESEGVAALEEGRERREKRFATVEIPGMEPVELLEQPFPGQPRNVAEAIAVQRGVWHGDVYYPPHRISRVRLGGED